MQKLTVERGFWLGRTVVTRGQWRAIQGQVPVPAFDGMAEPDRHPMVNVNWFEALAACAALQARFFPELGLPVELLEEGDRAKDCSLIRLKGGPGFRLPSELEWEYACRGGGMLARGLRDRPFGDGDEVLEQSGWFMGNSGERTHPVDVDPEPDVPPHPFGLVQMIGNVHEWCLDLYLDRRWKEARPAVGTTAHGVDPSDEGTATGTPSAQWYIAEAQKRDGSSLTTKERAEVLALYQSGPDHDSSVAALQAALDRDIPPSPRNRVIRGGSWFNSARGCRSAFRFGWGPVDRFRFQGFRVCWLPGPVVPDPSQSVEPTEAAKAQGEGQASGGTTRSRPPTRAGADDLAGTPLVLPPRPMDSSG